MDIVESKSLPLAVVMNGRTGEIGVKTGLLTKLDFVVFWTSYL